MNQTHAATPERAALLGPVALPCGATLPNRLAKAAMTEGLAEPDGMPGQRIERLYTRWASSGCGLLITGNVLIDRQHLERPGNVVVERTPSLAQARGFARWAEAAKRHGAHVWMQLNHAGRQTMAVVNPHPKAPSAVGLAMPGKQFGNPVAMSEVDIETVIGRFATAAEFAASAGFDGVQVHAAHGYLISQFLSPRANHRIDRWGGTLENRARLLLDVVRAVRQRVPTGFAVGVKLNSADFQKGGFGADESPRVVAWLGEEGVDLIEISGGNYEQPRLLGLDGVERPDTTGLPASTARREAYFMDFAAELRREARTPLMVTGGFRSARAMCGAVVDDGIDVIGLARPLCVVSDGPARLLSGEVDTLDRSESVLRLGPGLLGPRSPLAVVKMLNGFGSVYWYYQQIRRLGDGLQPDQQLGVLRALVREATDQRAWLARRQN